MLIKELKDERGEWMGSIEECNQGGYIAYVLVDSFLDDIYDKHFQKISDCEKFIKDHYLMHG